MAYWIALAFMVMVCGFSLLTAQRVASHAKVRLDVLQRRVEQQAHQPLGQAPNVSPLGLEHEPQLPLGDNPQALARDLEALVDEVFQDKDTELSRAALHQLLGYGVTTKEQYTAARRGLMRIPSLAGVAISIFVLASTGFDNTAFRFALSTLGMGIVTTGLCQLILVRARRAGRAFVEFVQMMERELKLAEQRVS